MVETISPVVHGGRTKTYWLSIALHVFGATAAAAAFGTLLGGLGALVGAPWGSVGALLTAALAVLYLLREAFGLPIPIFDRKKQVPEWWRTFYSKPVASLLYGLGLGVGFLTYLTFGTFVVVAVAAFASGDPLFALLLSGTFGAARSVAVAIATGTNTTDALEEPSIVVTGKVANATVLAVVALGAFLALV